MFELRNFREEDADALNRVALAAFQQYESQYTDWPRMAENVASMSKLAASGHIIVGETDGRIAGDVVYVSPEAPKSDFFEPSWSIIRMLVVTPEERGRGLGRALTEECIRLAVRDGASVIALHTTPIMDTALQMYMRMGFRYYAGAPEILGVAYGVYTKDL